MIPEFSAGVSRQRRAWTSGLLACAAAAGILPPNLVTMAGTWGTVSDTGDLTYLNLVHLAETDGTNADDLGDYRPGARARNEKGVRSPLQEAGLMSWD